jgi:hypothetical protein
MPLMEARAVGSGILLSVALFGIAAGLLFVGMPDRSGASPRFLRFAAAPVIYPPIILALLAIGLANLIASIAR